MFECVGEEILAVEEVDTGTQVAVVKTHYCWATKLFFEGGNTTTIGNPLSLVVAYKDWQDNLLPEENRPIHITTIGPGQTQELVLIPTNGRVEFDFTSEVPGKFLVRATAEFPCEPAEIEVVVS